MRYFKVILPFIFMAALQLNPANACQTASPEFAELLTSQWTSAFRRGDYHELQSYYAEDAVVSPFGRKQTIATAPEVRDYLEGFARTFEPLHGPETTLRVSCNTVLAFGTMTLKPRSGTMRGAFEVRYARVYERRGSYWLIAYETASEWRPLGRIEPPQVGPAGIWDEQHEHIQPPVPRPVFGHSHPGRRGSW